MKNESNMDKEKLDILYKQQAIQRNVIIDNKNSSNNLLHIYNGKQ
jgi:hypothetical protein